MFSFFGSFIRCCTFMILCVSVSFSPDPVSSRLETLTPTSRLCSVLDSRPTSPPTWFSDPSVPVAIFSGPWFCHTHRLAACPSADSSPTRRVPVSDLLLSVHSESFTYQEMSVETRTRRKQDPVLESLRCWSCFMCTLLQGVRAASPDKHALEESHPHSCQQEVVPGMQLMAHLLSWESNR